MSIWFTKAFIGAVLRKNGRWMGTLSEEGGDGGFSFSGYADPNEVTLFLIYFHV